MGRIREFALETVFGARSAPLTSRNVRSSTGKRDHEERQNAASVRSRPKAFVASFVQAAMFGYLPAPERGSGRIFGRSAETGVAPSVPPGLPQRSSINRPIRHGPRAIHFISLLAEAFSSARGVARAGGVAQGDILSNHGPASRPRWVNRPIVSSWSKRVPGTHKRSERSFSVTSDEFFVSRSISCAQARRPRT